MNRSSLNATVIPLQIRKRELPVVPALPTQRLALSHLGGTRFVLLSDIMYLKAAGAYTIVTLIGGEQITVSKPMSCFEAKIISQWYYRIHRSYILNIHYFREYLSGEGDTAVLTNGDKLQISRTRVADFLRTVEEITGCITI